MTLDEAVARLLALRHRLPVRGPDVEQAHFLLDELATTSDPDRRRTLVQRVLPLLLVMDGLPPEVSPIAVCLAVADEPVHVDGDPGGGDGLGERGDGEVLDGASTPSWSAGSGRRRGRPRARQPGPVEAPAMIERTPHLDVEAAQPITVGSQVRVSVYVDTRALREGEQGDELWLPALDELHLGVNLTVSPHFSVQGKTQDEIVVRAAEARSTTVTFELLCVGAGDGPAGVAASFVYEWRPAGSVWRELAIEGAARTVAGLRTDVPPGRLAVDVRARPADLVVTVAPSPDGDERHFDVTVASPHLDAFKAGVTVPWNLRSGTRDIVLGIMEAFTTADVGGRRAALIGAGREFFTITPVAFQQAFWALVDGGQPLRTIFVVTSEPSIPWELMIPHDGAKVRSPLGVDFAVGRWVHQGLGAPEQLLPIVDSYVIAPRYRGDRKLGFALEEERFVLGAFGGEPISPALITTIDAKLDARGASLLHLICHGLDLPSGQVLDLDRDEKLREIQLAGLAGLVRAVAERRPFVFINACEVGRATPSLMGTGGFAARFTQLGARCVIAPIWSVKDSVAGQVARLFYERVQAEPTLAFAEAMRDIRKRAYEGEDPEDSWAAYCFYGDPLAAQAVIAS